jgi:hypothetical protein
MIFGVEKQWAAQFEDMHLKPPDYIEGSGSSSFAIEFHCDTRFLGWAPPPRERPILRPSSGSSGSSGGSSGGGGGGGGGGSW